MVTILANFSDPIALPELASADVEKADQMLGSTHSTMLSFWALPLLNVGLIVLAALVIGVLIRNFKASQKTS